MHEVVSQTGYSDVSGAFKEVDLTSRSAITTSRLSETHFAHINLKTAQIIGKLHWVLSFIIDLDVELGIIELYLLGILDYT